MKARSFLLALLLAVSLLVSSSLAGQSWGHFVDKFDFPHEGLASAVRNVGYGRTYTRGAVQGYERYGVDFLLKQIDHRIDPIHHPQYDKWRSTMSLLNEQGNKIKDRDGKTWFWSYLFTGDMEHDQAVRRNPRKFDNWDRVVMKLRNDDSIEPIGIFRPVNLGTTSRANYKFKRVGFAPPPSSQAAPSRGMKQRQPRA